MNDGRVRFGVFEFVPATGELRRDGIPVKLQAQPARVLAVLVGHAGDVVTRETLQREVWGSGTHVDFERGLNFCIAQVRAALGDSADSPRFVATVPKQGYRFIAPVQTLGPAESAGQPDQPLRRRQWPILAVVLLAVGILIAWPLWGASEDERETVVVVPFYNETGRAELDVLAKNLADVTVARLATPERLPALSVIGNAPVLRNKFAREDVQGIARDLGAEWVVIGQLKSDGQGLRVVGHLIRASDMKHVWAQTFDDPDFGLSAQERTAESIAASISQTLASN
jgi:DNA-binding winged helix-turn-helix (wHTH) protein/TolB-like protein